MRIFNTVLVLVAVLLLSACDTAEQDRTAQAGKANAPQQPGVVVQRPRIAQQVLDTGRKVYQQHCAVCHGDKAQGNPQWRIKPASGMWLPPPLNGSGHAWHHSKKWLVAFIKNGSPPGKGTMPAWKDKLSDRQIEAVIHWFQSLWPDNVYFLWRQRDAE